MNGYILTHQTLEVNKHMETRNKSEGKCPVCNGTGYELFWRPEELYGGEMTQFARKCSRCSGKRRSEDFVGIPLNYKDTFNFEIYSVNIEKIKKLVYSFIKDFSKWNGSGKGLYLWSKTPGSGKTLLACNIAKSVMVKYDLQMRFITATDYISAVGDSFRRERGENDSSEVFRTCKLLILDDIGTQIGREWQQQELFRLINKRLVDGNVTIFTSNLPPEKLNLENRTIDRIIKSSIVIQMPEESIRLRKAKNEQEYFLKEVLGV